MTEATVPAPWLTAQDVKVQAGQTASEGIDDDALTLLTAAACAYVERVRTDLATDAGYVPTPDVKVAAAMLAYRFYARRNSPLGVHAGYDTGGTPGEGILRHDPDVAILLGIGNQRGGLVVGGVIR